MGDSGLLCAIDEPPTVSNSSELADMLLSRPFSAMILAPPGGFGCEGELGFVSTVEESSSSVSRNRSIPLCPAETAFFIYKKYNSNII